MNTIAISPPATPYTLGTLQPGPACCVPTPILEIKNLAIRYGENIALDGVSLDIYKGCITALIGPSGCGKTSFLSSLNRLTDLIPSVRVNGDVRFNGESIYAPGIDTRRLRTQIGMVFQKANPFPLSIRRNLEMPLKEHGVTHSHELKSRVQTSLEDVGLWDEVHDRLDSSALKLSGGQQQRLCIARALVLKPSVLLMDEPCSALDPISSGVVEDLILRLRGAYTVVIVTHNLAQAKRIANYAAFFWMKERVGKLIEFGHSQQLFEAPTDSLTEAYVNGARG